GSTGIKIEAQVYLGRSAGADVRCLQPQIGQRTAENLPAWRGRKSLQSRVVRSDDIALVIKTERAGTRVLQRALITGDEEAAAIDCEIERVVGDVDIALPELLGDAVDQHPAAGRARAAAENRVGVNVAELRTRLFEASGAGVGDVVAGHRKVLTRRA